MKISQVVLIRKPVSCLSDFEELLVTLMRLRLELSNKPVNYEENSELQNSKIFFLEVCTPGNLDENSNSTIQLSFY